MIAYAYGNSVLDLADKSVLLALYRFFDHSSAMVWIRITKIANRDLFGIICSLASKDITFDTWSAIHLFMRSRYIVDKLIENYYEDTRFWVSTSLKANLIPLYQARFSVGTSNVYNEPLLFDRSFDKSLMAVYQYWNSSKLFAQNLGRILVQQELNSTGDTDYVY